MIMDDDLKANILIYTDNKTSKECRSPTTDKGVGVEAKANNEIRQQQRSNRFRIQSLLGWRACAPCGPRCCCFGKSWLLVYLRISHKCRCGLIMTMKTTTKMRMTTRRGHNVSLLAAVYHCQVGLIIVDSAKYLK
jgi:hypothetical protein